MIDFSEISIGPGDAFIVFLPCSSHPGVTGRVPMEATQVRSLWSLFLAA